MNAAVINDDSDLSYVASCAAIALDAFVRTAAGDRAPVQRLARALGEYRNDLFVADSSVKPAHLIDPAIADPLLRALRPTGAGRPSMGDLKTEIEPLIADLSQDPATLTKDRLEALRDFAVRVSAAARTRRARRAVRNRRPSVG